MTVAGFFTTLHEYFGVWATVTGSWWNRWLLDMHRELAPFKSFNDPYTPKNALWERYVRRYDAKDPDLCILQAYFEAHNHDLRIGFGKYVRDFAYSALFEPITTIIGVIFMKAALDAEETVDTAIAAAGIRCTP